MGNGPILPGPPAAPTFKEALKEDKALYDDCTPCKVVGQYTCPSVTLYEHIADRRVLGSGAFIGLGVYTYMSGHSQLKKQESVILRSKSMFGMGSRRMSITGMSAGLIGLGIYRWFA
jgi:hypothetical protein